MATKAFDPLEGVTAKTTKEDLMDRLRKAAAALRKDDRTNKASLAAIESRLRAKGTYAQNELKQVICSATEAEWKESVEFLEEFADLLPAALQRLVTGGRVLIEHQHAA